jgi:hypothetical protein
LLYSGNRYLFSLIEREREREREIQEKRREEKRRDNLSKTVTS